MSARHKTAGNSEELGTLEVDILPQEFGPLHDLGRIAEQARDWETAARWWSLARERFPKMAPGYTGGATASRALGRIDEANQLLQYAVERFPNEFGPLHDLGGLAEHQRDWEAAARWRTLAQERHPAMWQGYTGLARALRELGRADDAESLLCSTIERFPDDLGPLHDLARHAEWRQDWREAARWWGVVQERFPDAVIGYAACANTLVAIGDFDEAERLLSSAKLRFPDESGLYREQARLVAARWQWNQADQVRIRSERELERWNAEREHSPENPDGYTNAIAALRELGRTDDADVLANAGVQRFPSHVGLNVELARLEERQGSWDTAFQRWTVVVKQAPGSVMGYLVV